MFVRRLKAELRSWRTGCNGEKAAHSLPHFGELRRSEHIVMLIFLALVQKMSGLSELTMSLHVIVIDICYSFLVTRSETVRGEIRKPDWGGGHVDVEKACGE